MAEAFLLFVVIPLVLPMLGMIAIIQIQGYIEGRDPWQR